MKFCHLHLHNEYSVLDGVGTSKQYAELAKELGQTALAITNHGNIDGAIEHQKQCIEAGINPIIGCEMYMVPDLKIKQRGEKRYHITLLVENQTGWENLLQLLTIANIEGNYYRPRIDHENLKKHLEGLVVLSACSASFLHMGNSDNYVANYVDIIGKDRIFFEVMPHDLDDQVKTNKEAVRLSKKYGIKLVATNDCHYPTEKATLHQEVLLAIQTKKSWNDPKRWKFNCDGLFLRSYDEMFEAFEDQGVLSKTQIKKALRQSNKVAEICQGFRIEQQPVFLPSIKNFPSDEDEIIFLENRIHRGFKKRLRGFSYDEKQLYKARIEEEMELIISKGFQRYFLILWDLIVWCKKNDIMTGPGRGSVGGSLVGYLLYLHDANSLVYGLEFFRFVSADRNDLPDIDIDFQDDKIDEVRGYLEDKYGVNNVAGLSTFLKMKGRMALRDVARVFDVPLQEVDFAAKGIVDADEGEEISTSLKESPELKRFAKKYPQVVEIAAALEGQIRGYGQHAAGICVSATDLTNGKNCNLVIRKKVVVCNWDMRNAEYCGLMKLDALSLKSLTVLNATRKMIMRNHGADIDYKALSFDDPKVFEQINLGHTNGAFQIGSDGLTNYCQDLKIDSFQTVYAAAALWRPGPMQSGMTEEYAKRKNKKRKIEKIHPVFDKITQETFGVIVYQEQVMKAVNQLSGIPMSTCNKIRKIMGKSMGNAAFDKYKDEFLQGCKNLGLVAEDKAIQIWDMMSKFGGYGFNLSHSVEYSMVTYWDMWSKTYYPNEYLACCLSRGDKEKNKGYMKEARRLKLTINMPKIGASHATEWNADTNGKLYAPFASIEGVGPPTAKLIAAAKLADKKRRGFFNAGPSQKIKGVDKGTIQILTDIQAFDPDYITTKADLKTFRKLFTF